MQAMSQPIHIFPIISEVNSNLDEPRHDKEFKASRQSAARIVCSVKAKAKESRQWARENRRAIKS